MLDIRARRAGGAPLHYLLAYLAGLVDPGLTSLRLISVAFAVASVPVIAALVARLTDRRTALVATLLAAVSWTTLYHGIYARMYSLFLFTAVLSLLLLLERWSKEPEAAGPRGPARRSRCWRPSRTASSCSPSRSCTSPCSGSGGRSRSARRLFALAAVLVLATPLWRTYALLASRFDVGVGESSSELGSPFDVVEYLWEVFGDFIAGWPAAAVPAALLAAAGLVVLARTRPEAAILTAIVAGVPALALVAGRLGPGGLARDAASHLPPAFRDDGDRGRSALGREAPWAARARRSSRCSSGSSSPRRSSGASTRPAGCTPASRRPVPRRGPRPRTGSLERAGPTTSSSATSRRIWTRGSRARPSIRVSCRVRMPGWRSRRWRRRASRSVGESGCSMPPRASTRRIRA